MSASTSVPVVEPAPRDPVRAVIDWRCMKLGERFRQAPIVPAEQALLADIERVGMWALMLGYGFLEGQIRHELETWQEARRLRDEQWREIVRRERAAGLKAPPRPRWPSLRRKKRGAAP